MKTTDKPFRFDGKGPQQDRPVQTPMQAVSQRTRTFEQRLKFNFLAERQDRK